VGPSCRIVKLKLMLVGGGGWMRDPVGWMRSFQGDEKNSFLMKEEGLYSVLFSVES